jgi:hypothetical protein
VETDALQVLAEFGIALGGFTSIVVVFGRRGGEFHPVDRFRVFAALILSLGGAFLALVPVGFELLGYSSEVIWRASSVILVLALALFILNILRSLRRLPPEASAVLSRPFFIVNLSILVSSLLASTFNATGLFFAARAGVYFFAVLGPLIVGAIAFVRMVFVRPIT